VIEPGERSAGVEADAGDAVVRPFGRAVSRPCARPSCQAPARASLIFNYANREAWLDTLHVAASPQVYDLCAAHAARTQPPHGWQLRDRRPEEEREPDEPPPLGGEDTVAVLAAALRAVPDLPQPERVDTPVDQLEDDPSPVLELDLDVDPPAVDAGGAPVPVTRPVLAARRRDAEGERPGDRR
jgi:hypothetical protein